MQPTITARHCEISDALRTRALAVVERVGSLAEGEVTDVRFKGMWGKSGGIHLAVKSVNINGTTIRLKGDMDSRGETGTAARRPVGQRCRGGRCRQAR